jgi:hypothetical protein
MASAQIANAARESEVAFYRALRSGRLSGIPTAENYVGNYMFMGHQDGRALFKHIETRQYIA